MFSKNHFTYSPHFLSLIIPVYKQEKIIVKNIRQIKQILDSIRHDYEIIVVFDGLVDSSYKKVKQYLLLGLFSSVTLKKRQPKSSGVWYFRINKQFRAYAYISGGVMKVFYIDNH